MVSHDRADLLTINGDFISISACRKALKKDSASAQGSSRTDATPLQPSTEEAAGNSSNANAAPSNDAAEASEGQQIGIKPAGVAACAYERASPGSHEHLQPAQPGEACQTSRMSSGIRPVNETSPVVRCGKGCTHCEAVFVQWHVRLAIESVLAGKSTLPLTNHFIKARKLLNSSLDMKCNFSLHANDRMAVLF